MKAQAKPILHSDADSSKKFTSKLISVKKRYVPAAQKVLDRCLIPGVTCSDVLSAIQGLARVIVAICSTRRVSSCVPPLSPVSRPKSWSISPSPELHPDHIRSRGYSATPSLNSCTRKITDEIRRKSSEENILEPTNSLELLRRCSLNCLDPLISHLSNRGTLDEEGFDRVIETIEKLCNAVNADIHTEDDGTEDQYNVMSEVFTNKQRDAIDDVKSFFARGYTQVTLPTVSRFNNTRRSKSCIIKKTSPAMRRSLSDAKKYFISQFTGPPEDDKDSEGTMRDSIISTDSSSSAASYDDEGVARNLPRYQKKKIKAALAATVVPVVGGPHMRRRTSTTITKDEAILLGVTMTQLRRTAIGEESDESDIEDVNIRLGDRWRDSGIDTISSTYTNISHTDEDELIEEREESPTITEPATEFLVIEVSGELGGHFSKSRKTLGQSPNNLGRYFRIHVNTNIEKLQLQSYVIYKKFKDVINLYEDIERLYPEGVVQLEKPDRSIFNKKQNKLQVERLMLNIAKSNKLRTLEPVISFLKPDCLPTEGSDGVAPKTPQCDTTGDGGETNQESRDHPNSATQEVKIAEFYTPNETLGEPGTEHAPHHISNSYTGDSPSLVRKTFKNLLNQRSQVDDKMDDDEYEPILIKDDKGEIILLMTWSYEKDGYTIEGGRREQLVEQLYSGNCVDADYIHTFLLGYKQIMEPEELMDMLIHKFEESQISEDNCRQEADMIKLRLSNIVTQWLERVWVDFHYSETMINKLERFIQLVSAGHPQFLPVAMKLQNTMEKKKRDWEMSIVEQDAGSGSAPHSQCTSPTQSPSLIRRANSDTKNKKKNVTLADINVGQLARHIHCVDFDLMAKVEIHEYFTYFCRKKDPQYHQLTQHLDNWIHYWNTVSSWVSSEILRDETPKLRAAKIERLIDIAKHLKQLFSLNMLYAFITGFNHSSIQRLKKTWEHVPNKAQSSLSDLEELMSQDKSFAIYRKHLLKVPRTVCTIPLLSLILRDIEFLNVNSPKLKNGLWNFGKLRLIKTKISELERHKLIRPQSHIQTDEDILNFCKSLKHVPPHSFYDISLEREPREAKPDNPRPISISSLSSITTSSSN